MDDFKLVLGMDFLGQVKAVPLPFLRSLAILEDEAPCVVPTMTGSKTNTTLLSAMQLKKGFNKGEVTYMAALKEETSNDSPTSFPKEIAMS